MKCLSKAVLILIAVLALNVSLRAQQPNILWIITDDQRADALACYNRATTGKDESPLGYVESPNLDRIAEEGVLFLNAYCNSPACAPSRSSMHTGQYPHHNGHYDFTQGHTMPDFTKPVVPEILREQGYGTAHFGKSGVYIFEWGPGQTYDFLPFYDVQIDHQRDLARLGFGDWSRLPDIETFWFPNYSRDLARGTYESLTEAEKQQRNSFDPSLDILRAYTRSQSGLILGGVSPQPASETTDAYILKEYLRFLEHTNQDYTSYSGRSISGADSTRPLMVNIGFHFPHTPILPPKEYRDRFAGKVYSIPEFDKTELDRLPEQLKKLYRQMKTDELTFEEKQQFIRDYYAFCAFGDSLIGEAVTAFREYSEQHGQEYLVIIACGDHGWHLGEQGIGAKFGPYDYSNHTAVLVLSSDEDKFPAGGISTKPVEFVDFAPTMLAAAGVDLSDTNYGYLDGYDLAGVWDGSLARRDYVLGEMNTVYGPRAYLRSDNFAFSMRVRENNGIPSATNPPNNNINWALTTSSENVEMALYDLRIDPKERTNLAYTEAYLPLSEWFRKKLGNIVLGDARIECDWSQENYWNRSSFALGSDDKVLNIPPGLIPDTIDWTKVTIELYKKDGDLIEAAPNASIRFDTIVKTTDKYGSTSGWFSKGTYRYTIDGKGVKTHSGTIYIGDGETLFRDTLEVEKYEVSLKIIGQDNLEPISMAEVTLDNEPGNTSEDGIISFEGKGLGNYNLSVHARHYNKLIGEISVQSDTTISIVLVPLKYNIDFTVHDARYESPISGVEINLQNKRLLTNISGQAVSELPHGDYQLIATKEKYSELIHHFSIEGDTNILVYMNREKADIRFLISDGTFMLEGTLITLTGPNSTEIQDSLQTDQLGLARRNNLFTDSVYSYTVAHNNFSERYGSFVLFRDSTIQMMMFPVFVKKIPEAEMNLTVYPVPASDKITVGGLMERTKIHIYNQVGILSSINNIGPGRAEIDISSLPKGLYLLRSASDLHSLRFLKR